MTGLTIGSEQHKELFCRAFLDTHLAYDVETLRWPALDAASTERLRALPFWDEAVSTERSTAVKVQAQAELETDAEIPIVNTTFSHTETVGNQTITVTGNFQSPDFASGTITATDNGTAEICEGSWIATPF